MIHRLRLELFVDDLDRSVAVVVGLALEVRQRPWGQADFRVLDPDAYSLRVTQR